MYVVTFKSIISIHFFSTQQVKVCSMEQYQNCNDGEEIINKDILQKLDWLIINS